MGRCSAVPCIHQGHVGTTIPKRLMLPSGRHTMLANGTQRAKDATDRERFRGEGLEWNTVFFFFFLRSWL